MNNEFEIKVIDFNFDEVIANLRRLKAKETPEVLMRRYVFDMESENSKWIRLRDNGSKVTLTYKYKIIGNTKVGETVELEVEVSDFDKTAQILKQVPFKDIYYQENKIHKFELDGIEFSIATWPLLEPYLEVESTGEQKVQEGLRLLGLEGKDVGDLDINELYNAKGIDMHSYLELKF